MINRFLHQVFESFSFLQLVILVIILEVHLSSFESIYRVSSPKRRQRLELTIRRSSLSRPTFRASSQMSVSIKVYILQQWTSLQQRFLLVMYSPFSASISTIQTISSKRVIPNIVVKFIIIRCFLQFSYFSVSKLNYLQKVNSGDRNFYDRIQSLNSSFSFRSLPTVSNFQSIASIINSLKIVQIQSCLFASNQPQLFFCRNSLYKSFWMVLNLLSSICCRLRSYSSLSLMGWPIFTSYLMSPRGSSRISILSEMRVKQFSRMLLIQQVYSQRGRDSDLLF